MSDEIIWTGWWDEEDKKKNEVPVTKLQMYVFDIEMGECRPATVSDMFECGFSPREMLLEEIGKKSKQVTKWKYKFNEALDTLCEVIKPLNLARESGLSFEDMGDTEGLEEALELATELLLDEGRDI